MSDGSEFSFEYEDEVSLSSVTSDVDTTEDIADLAQNLTLATSICLEHTKKRPLKSPNTLSGAVFRPLSVSTYIHEEMVRPAQTLKRDFLPQFSLEETLLLLHYKKWSVDEVTSEYFDDWSKLRDACGLDEDRSNGHKIETVASFACPICCETGALPVFALSCGHDFCALCYKRYVASSLARGVLIRCMAEKCSLSLSYSEVALLLDINDPDEKETNGYFDAVRPERALAVKEELSGDLVPSTPEEMDEYDLQFENLDPGYYAAPEAGSDEPLTSNPLLVNAARAAIDASQKYRWCPSVDCTELVEIGETRGEFGKNDLAGVAVVTCARSHAFCFDCHYENHLPCPCWVAKLWIKRCEDDSETVNWIDANTQGCPKCQAVIEKNGGCNHMVCGTCQHEFCWICLGDWAVHKSSWWSCNRFDPREVEELKKKKSEKQHSLGRYLHFYRRFSVHQVSMEGDQKTLKNVHRCMLQYMKAQVSSSERTRSWNDVQFLSDAIKSLASGRKTLMWTYAFAFYLQKSNFSQIFEGMQDYLNKAVEDLSSLFEEIQARDSPPKTAAKITSKKSEIMALASLVSRRRDLLIECAHTGLQQGTLSFMKP